MNYIEMDQYEFYKKLKEDFPLLFGEHLRFIETAPGWNNLIYEFFEKVSAMKLDNYKLMQIKEKFGGLRLYADGGNDEIRNLVSSFEQRASVTCESCGAVKSVGAASINGWLSVLCKPCYLTEVEKRNPDTKEWKKFVNPKLG